jgi:hypothetical protein
LTYAIIDSFMACGGADVLGRIGGVYPIVIGALYTTIRYVIFPLAPTKLLPK